MFRLFIRYFLSMLVAATVGFTLVHFYLYRAPPWQRDTQLELHVAIRGTQGQAVAGAELVLFAPSRKELGRTDSKGDFHGNVRVPRGLVVVLEAQGPTYRIRKDIPVPRMARFRADVRLDPREARLGHMSLISKTLEEMSQSLGQKAQPRPSEGKAAGSVSLPPSSSPVPASTPLVRAPVPMPQPTREIVALELAQEAPREEHRMDDVFSLVSQLRDALHERFREAGIARLVLRPLVASPDPYFELIGYDKNGKNSRSVLFKAVGVDSFLVRRAMDALLRTDASGLRPSGGRLVVHTMRPEKTRAYLNGVALSAKVFQGRAEFSFVAPRGNATHVALAATADERPLVRKVALKEVLGRTVEWTLPEPSLSLR